MDFAQRLTDLRQRPPEQLLQSANRYLPTVAVAILILVLADQLADITWTVMTPADVGGPSPVIATIGPGDDAGVITPAYDALDGWKPFGEPPDAEAAATLSIDQLLDAPDTSLNLQLHGTHGYSDPETAELVPENGHAFISSGRAEQTLYYVGDVIEGGSGATLHSVYSDRVLLDRGGRLETLRLPQEFANTTPVTGRPALPAARQATPVSSLQDAISENAARFTQVIRTVPHMEGGQVIGYRLTPGRDRDAFAALGLEPGDVLTEVNGMILNDPQSAAQIFTALGEAQMANLTLLRDGSPQVLVIDMSQIEALTEDRQ